jgi:hypothetical protein
MSEIINRYGKTNTFTKLDDGNYLWEGDFSFSRASYKFCAKNSYSKFLKDHKNSTMQIDEFFERIYEWDEHTRSYDPRYAKYQDMIEQTPFLNMVDPSGGPYLTSGMEVPGTNDIIDYFEPCTEGYKIMTIKDK